MRSQRVTGTAPEAALLAAVRRLGLRPRVDAPLGLPNARRRADLSWPTLRVAVFVDGCFWHGCPVHSRPVVNNGAWWAAKIARNQARDAETTALLEAAGWAVLRFWEHADPGVAAGRIALVVLARRRH